MSENDDKACAAELDAAFERHGEYQKCAQKDYEAIYERLVNKLSASHLEPIAKILLEREKITLDTEKSIKSIQNMMRELLLRPWNLAWKEHIGDNITKLEMLKEHFKQYEGIDWKVSERTVDERIQPMRMEFKLKRQQWLQRQIDLQNQRIEKLMAKTIQNRCYAQLAMDETIKLGARLNNIDIEGKKEQLMKDFNQVLDG